MLELLPKNLQLKTLTNAKGNLVIQQTQSRELKKTIISTLLDLLTTSYDVETGLTGDGIAIAIPNEEDGSVYLTLDIKVKPLDYDMDTEILDYKQKQEEKLAKKEKKEAA